MLGRILQLLTWALLPTVLLTAPASGVHITSDVVYGHKSGLALTFDVFAPEEDSNGAGILFMVSGGWYSRWSPPEETQRLFRPLTDQGFTVFAVRHGSSPKFSIPEAVADVRRSVRYIRLHASDFNVDPTRLGAYGMSAGGHLSLMLGTTADQGDSSADDPVLRASNRVRAVAAWVAPTDLRIMVWDAPGRLEIYKQFPALDLDQEAAERMSPLVHVSNDDAPTLLVVGDQDKLVPMKHSEDIYAAFEKNDVPAELIVLEGAGHGFQAAQAEEATQALVAWFQRHLLETE